LHKKGSWAYPLEFVTYVGLLTVILVIYGIIFFGFKVAEPDAPVISAKDYQDSTTLINFLRTPTEVNGNKMTIADSINLFYNSQLSEQEFKNLISNTLNSLPKPNEDSNYKLEIGKDVVFDKSNIFQAEKIVQGLYFPLSNKKIVLIKLSLKCNCNEEEVFEVA